MLVIKSFDICRSEVSGYKTELNTLCKNIHSVATSYTKIHFGKSLDEDITAVDVINYFTVERDESLTLEFKSYYEKEKPNFDGVLRTITAFLNSEGGLLIFGAPPEVTIREKYRVVKGNPTPIPTAITTKDDIVRRISDNISYMPIGILVKPVEMAGGSFVYLIEVQESSSKPHQYKTTKQYPVRLDGQSIGAPHYLVEALFKQVRRPELKGFLRIISYRLYDNPGDSFNTTALQFEVTIFNVSKSVNDTDVYIQLIAGTGMFIPGVDARHQYSPNGKRVTVLGAASLITNGLPTRLLFNYQITTDESNALENGILKIILGFGGTNSETKFSKYFIGFRPDRRFSPSDWGRTFNRPKDLNNLIQVEKEENVSASDRWLDNEDERIEHTLGGI